MYSYILIDTNNLYWRTVVSAFKNLQELDKLEKAEEYTALIVQNFFERVNQIKNNYGLDDCKYYFLFDNPDSAITARKDISWEYKHSRDTKRLPPIFYRVLEVIESLLEYYSNNFFLCKIKNLEADDLVYPILKYSELNNNKKALVISVDMDWARAITEHVHWFNWTTLYTMDIFETEFGFSPKGKSIQMYKAIHGDSADQIKNAIPGLPKEILLDIVQKFSTIQELINNVWSSTYPKNWQFKIKEAEVQMKINYKLADYIQFNNNPPLVHCKENIKTLKYWFKLLNIPLESRMVDLENDDFFQAIPSKVRIINGNS